MKQAPLLLHMKIYFAGSIRGGRHDKELYLQIIALMEKYGRVLTEHIGEQGLSTMGETDSHDTYIYERDMAWLREADVVVAEITTPSLGVGYEIGKMDEQKPLLCLYREMEGRRHSAMLTGNNHLRLREYKELADVEKILSDFFRDIRVV
jgi:nucleoside 2-deoxyribosyltransferase